MAWRTRTNWTSSYNCIRHRKGKRRTPSGAFTFSRRLRMEPLEDRRLLSITVNTLVDENDGIAVGGISLRDAIAAAVSGDTINFAASLTAGGPATILLTHGELLINKGLTIAGPGANLLTIDASGNDPTPTQDNFDGSRVFDIDDGSATDINVVISGVMIRGADGSWSGGIENIENLTLMDSTITDNAGQVAGGINNYRHLTVIRCTIESNISEVLGSGINSQGFAATTQVATLTISDSAILNNSALIAAAGINGSNSEISIYNTTIRDNGQGILASGPGIAIESGSLSINGSLISSNASGGIIFKGPGVCSVTNSVITQNRANQGGGIFVYGDGFPTLTVTGCEISYNSAPVGGGICAERATIEISQSTISQNGGNIGGGLHLFQSSAIVKHSTIDQNFGGEFGGGISVLGGSLTLDETIVATNRGSLGRDIVRLFGASVTATYSLIGENAESGLTEAPVGSPDASGNVIGGPVHGAIDPKLGSLTDNGGATQTRALLASSPAINAGDPTAIAGSQGVPVTDQRGAPFTRVSGGRIDIGAVEKQSIPAAVFGDYNQSGIVDAGDYVLWRKTQGATGVTPFTGADGSGNGSVGQEDYVVWRAHFGTVVPLAAAGSGAGLERQGANAGTLAAISESSSDSVIPHSALSEMLPVFASKNLLQGVSRSAEAQTHLRVHPVGLAPGCVRDDAMVAWVESDHRLRRIEASEPELVAEDSTKNSREDSHDALDIAVGELTSWQRANGELWDRV